MTTHRDAWSDAPAVFVLVPTCPHCGSARRDRKRTQPRESDGSRTRRIVCPDCKGRWLLVEEFPEPLPELGRDDQPTE